MQKVLAGILVGVGLALTTSAAFADEHMVGGPQTTPARPVTTSMGAGITSAGVTLVDVPSGRVDHDRQ